MQNEFSRTACLLGEQNMKKLASARVAVFGLGGVGGYVAEALVRSGIGALDFIDGDRVDISNLNRQILALRSTLGRYKAELAKERALDINPEARIIAYPLFFDSSTAHNFDFSDYDYVVDAIDNVTSKLLLVEMCSAAGTPIISCMGAGNKLSPSGFEIADIYSTSICPLARVMRRELKKRGVEKLKVAYSREQPVKAETESSEADSRPIKGSVAFVPAAAGLQIASEVVKDIINDCKMI